MPPDDFPGHVAELLGYLADDLPAEHAFASLAASLPSGAEGSPDPWMLGSSPDSARWAGELGLPYCIADFINPDGVVLADIYRRSFRPARWCEAPHLMVATWTIAAASRAEAERLARPSKMMFWHLVRGRLIAVPTFADADAWAVDHNGPDRSRRMVLGTADEVRREIEQVATLYGADEMMLVNILPDHEARRRSYELVADVFALAGAVTA